MRVVSYIENATTVMWSCGQVVTWSCGQVVMWSSGHVSNGDVAKWSSGNVAWPSGHVVMWSIETQIIMRRPTRFSPHVSDNVEAAPT